MNQKVEEAGFAFNGLKWLAVVALVMLAAVGNSYFSDDQLPFFARILAIVGIFVVAGLIAWRTDKGNAFVELLRSSVTEVRKVVWPTREETNKTTLLVIVVVFIAAIILWLLDMFFGYIASLIIG